MHLRRFDRNSRHFGHISRTVWCRNVLHSLIRQKNKSLSLWKKRETLFCLRSIVNGGRSGNYIYRVYDIPKSCVQIPWDATLETAKEKLNLVRSVDKRTSEIHMALPPDRRSGRGRCRCLHDRKVDWPTAPPSPTIQWSLYSVMRLPRCATIFMSFLVLMIQLMLVSVGNLAG